MEVEYKITVIYKPALERDNDVYTKLADWSWGDVDDYIVLYDQVKFFSKKNVATSRILFLSEDIECLTIESHETRQAPEKDNVVSIKKDIEKK